MERWFLAGAVVGLIILLFDKPLAAEIVGEFAPNNPIDGPTSIVSAVSGPSLPAPKKCGNTVLNVSVMQAPQSPSSVVRSPSQYTWSRTQFEEDPQNYIFMGTIGG
jgi:hypothetical protein